MRTTTAAMTSASASAATSRRKCFMGYPPFREARPTRTQPTQSHYSRQEYRKGAEEVCEHSPGLGMVLVVPCP